MLTTQDGNRSSQPKMVTLTQADLSKRIIIQRTELLNKLGNKTYAVLKKEMTEVEENYEREKNELLPKTSWKIRIPLCVAFNTLFCFSFLKYGKYIQKMNSYIGYKINHNLPLGYAITWV